MEYLVIAEEGPEGFSAYVPDLPGCITVGETLEEIEFNMREAVGLYLEGLAEKGLPIPPPMSHPFRIAITV